jgi:glucose/arabinose dehydrogenase
MMPLMHHSRLLAAIACSALLAGCGGSSGSDGGNGGNGGNGGSGGGGKIPISARLGWDQQAADSAQLNTLKFVLYLDDVRSDLTDASCTTAGSAGDFPCASGLPSMTAGQHTLQLASYVAANPGLQSARSAPLTVTVSATGGIALTASSDGQSSSASVPAPPPAGELTTSDGMALRIDAIAALERPAAIAVAAGRIFIAYAGNGSAGATRIHVITDGTVTQDAELAVEPANESGGILALAVDPDFERTHFVYALDVAAGASPAFRLTRYREAGGRLGQRAVLLGDVPAAARPSGGVAFGTDGQLYVAFDDGGDPESARRLGSYNGKVLRLEADGSAPPDRRGGSPVFASNFRSPRSLSWDPATSSLWIADPVLGRVARLRPGAGRTQGATTYSLPLAGGPVAVAMYRGTLMPGMRGDLLAASADEPGILLRARFTGTDQNTIATTERLPMPGGAAVRLIEQAPDGAIYVATDSQVLRVGPQ